MDKKIKIINLVFCFVMLALFIAFSILVSLNHNFYIDKFNNFVTTLRTPFWNRFFKVFTFIGSFYSLAAIFLVCFVLLFFKFKQKKQATILMSAFITMSLILIALKEIFKRPRPENLMIVEEIGFAFPSWHTIMSIFVFGVVIWMIFNFAKKNMLKYILIFLMAVVVDAVAFSRIYLGVHYLSDVLASYCFGLFGLSLYFGIIYFNKQKPK